MAEYISRDDAIEAAKHAWAKGLEPSQYIEAIPAADVVSVVRCKNCKHCISGIDNKFWYCGRRYPIVPTKTEGYCDWAWRKEDAP